MTKKSTPNNNVMSIASRLGLDQNYALAEFMAAIESGEISGDVVVLDEDGNEIRQTNVPHIIDVSNLNA